MKLRIGNDAIFKVAFMDGDELIETSSIKQIQAWFVPKRKSGSCILNTTRINEMYNDLCYSYLPTATGRSNVPGQCIIDNDDIYVCFRAKDQKKVGLYGLVITFTINCENMVIEERTYTVDSCCDVELCPSCDCGCSNEGVFTSDIVVSLTDDKSFGKYLNGDIVPAKGKTARQVIEDALNESTSTIPTITNFALNIGPSLTTDTDINAGTYNATFVTTNSTYITEIKLYDLTNNTLIQTLSGKTSPQTVTLPAVTTHTAGQTQQYRLTAVYATGTVNSNIYTVTWSAPTVTNPALTSFSMSNPSTTSTTAESISGSSTVTFAGTNLSNASSLVLSVKKSTDSAHTTLNTWTDVTSPKTITLSTYTLSVGESITFKLAAFISSSSTEVSSRTVTCTRIDPTSTNLMYYTGLTAAPTGTIDLSTYTSEIVTSGSTYTTTNIDKNTFVVAFPSTMTISKITDNAEIPSTWYDSSASEDHMTSRTGTATYNSITYTVWYVSCALSTIYWDRTFNIIFA